MTSCVCVTYCSIRELETKLRKATGKCDTCTRTVVESRLSNANIMALATFLLLTCFHVRLLINFDVFTW